MPLILGTNSIKDTGYDVANSCRFNSGDSPKMAITPSGGSLTTGTFSTWVKRSKLGAEQNIVSWDGSGSQQGNILFQSGDNLLVQSYNGSGWDLLFTTDAKYRDPSAWMHICVAFDTTQGTEGNRFKLYVNGTQVTSFDDDTYPSEDGELQINSKDSSVLSIGQYNNSNYLGGYLAETVWIDGTAYAASDFGEFDSDGSPTIWKPKDVSGLTFGTNGFYCDYEASDNLGNDANGGTDLTETNLAATDQATDSPTNNFCTLNPLGFTEGTLSEGNTEIDQNGSAGRFCAGTIQPSNGAWYFEAKVLNYGSQPRHFVGIGRNEETYTGTASAGASSIGYSLETQTVLKADSTALDLSSADSPATDDIYMIAYDIDNLKIYLGKNGTWLNSGDPAAGSGNVTTLVSGTDYAPITGALNASSNSARNNDWQFNFGNPTFAISSGNADGDGYGNF
jgi:hypothetical protein